MKQLFLLLLISYVAFCPSRAQENNIFFERIGVKEGLPMLNVEPHLQDRNGFLWFSTPEGLLRYDGYGVKAFKYDRLDTNSLSDNAIVSTYEDRQGMIWVGTSGNGLCKFNPYTEKFTRFPAQSHLPNRLHSQTITAISEDKEGMLWLGTQEGITRFDPKKGTFTRYLHNPADPASISTNSWIWKIKKDKEGTLWIGTDQGLNRLNLIPEKKGKPSEVTFTRFLHDPANANSLSHPQVMSLVEDKEGILWIGTLNGLNSLDKKTGTITRYLHDPHNPNSLSSNRVNWDALTVDYSSDLWIGTDSGLNKLNRERTRFTHYLHHPADDKTLSSNLIRSLLVDRSGTLWIGTLSSGLNKLDPQRRHITHYCNEPSDPFSLSHNTIHAICGDKSGNIWIGTEGGGLNQLDTKTGKFTHYRSTPNNPHGLQSDYIGSILEDRDGNLWIGGGEAFNNVGQGGGISLLDRKTGRFRYILPSTTHLFNFIYTIYEDRQAILWFGTTNGVRSYDRKHNLWKHYPHDANNPTGISDYWVSSIGEDKLGNLWIGTGDGLNKMDRKTGKFTHYRNKPKDPGSIANNDIKCIYQDSKQDLWIGTRGGGLSKLNPERETFTTYTGIDGLPSNNIYRIEEDEQGTLWVATNNGLCRFSPTSNTFTTLDYTDGLQGNQFASGQMSAGASFKSRDGILYFGGYNGLNAIHPEKLNFNSYVPPVVITGVKLFDKMLPGKNMAKEWVLAYDQNFLSFEFTALSYTNSEKNQYAYQLEGVDKNWVYSGNRRLASYTNLSPGEYTFRVKGSNNDGLWNEQGASLRIVIHPPFWRTTWAYISYSLLFVAALLMARKAIVNRERLRAHLRVQQVEAEKLRELDSLKSRFFSNVSHEFRTPLSIIMGIAQKWSRRDTLGEEQKTDFGMIGRNASRLLQLINQLLDLSRLEAGKLSPQLEAENITAHLRAIAASFESLAQSKAITYRYALPLQSVWVLTDRDKLEKIVNNLLSNAIKFTASDGQVAFTASLEESGGKAALRLVVQDTGIGISEEHLPHIFDRFYQADPSATRAYEGTGIGLALTRELTELLGGSIQVESNREQGSIFRINLPLQLTEPPQALTTPEEELQQTENPILTEAQEKTYPSLSKRMQAPGKGQAHVLIVEDNVDLRTFIKESLSADFIILEARDGQTGLQKAIETIPDLILSDVMMPGMDGFTLCGKLKTDERTSHIPLILLTAKADMASKLTGLTNQADDYLIKPFQIEELQVRIQNLIAQRQQLRQRFSRQFSRQSGEGNLPSAEEKFLQKAASIVEANLANTEFDVETFSREMGMSSSQLRRKLSALTNQAPADFIRLIRLQKAASLLQSRQGNVSEVALMTGFTSLNYFTRCFKEHFGKTPSEFIRESHDIKVGP